MRHTVLIMVLATACGNPPPPAQPGAPAPATAAQLDQVVARLEALERNLVGLEERLAGVEERQGVADPLADDEADELDEVAERLARIQERIDELGPGSPGAPAAPTRPPGPDPAEVYAVPADGYPFEGTPTALITIVEGREFACPYCDKVRATMAQLLVDYQGQIRVVYRSLIVHPQVATEASRAACAAGKQGRYLEMANDIFDKAFAVNRDLSRARMDALAADLGLDMGRFAADIAGPCVAEVVADHAELRKLGMYGTPGFFINGRFLSGARPIEHFKALIEEELVKAKERVRKGTRARDYYRKWVLDKGRKSAP
jgi:protein-disulfide isomerase